MKLFLYVTKHIILQPANKRFKVISMNIADSPDSKRICLRYFSGIDNKSALYKFSVTDLGDAVKKNSTFSSCLYAKRKTGQEAQVLLWLTKEVVAFVK
jgi:hypothetical protein